MGQVHRITLTHKCGNVPKGTSIEVPTTDKNDHGAAAWIPSALRKAGYTDEDFQGCGIGSTSNWEWTPIPGDSTELCNELRRYGQSVKSQSEATDSSSDGKKEKKKKKKKKSESSSDGGDGKGFFGLDRWDPLNILLFIIFLPFLIIWWIIKLALKLCGIWAIINFFSGGDD